MSIEFVRCFPPLPKTERGRAVLVSTDPKNKTLLYTNGFKVVLRDVKNPSECDIFSQHSRPVSAAKYAPTGFYIASGDISGKVLIWDTLNKEHILKYEYQALSGTVKDIDWTEDSKRLAIVGEGREKYGVAILWDSGSSCGNLTAHSKSINSVSIKQNRPYRLVTGSEDTIAGFFEGPPFKFNCTVQNHKNFVNSVRFAPDGSVFITGGSDKKAFVFDGKTAEFIGELDAGDGNAHKGGIYAIAFKSDSKLVATASGDKTVRIWDVATRALQSTTTCGSSIEDMQLGATWAEDEIVTVSLSGYLNYISPECPEVPSRVIKGHTAGIFAMALSDDRQTLFTGDGVGRIVYWNVATGEGDVIEGKGHGYQVISMSLCQDALVSAAMDDVVIFSSVSQKKYGNSLKLDSQPRGVAAGPNGIAVAACLKEVVVFQNGGVTSKLSVSYEPSCAALHPSGQSVAIGSTQAKTVFVYNIEGGNLKEKHTVTCTAEVTAVAYSPNGEYLVATDAGKRTTLCRTSDYEVIERDAWQRHAAKILCVAFSPDSQRVATGSLDTNLACYRVNKGMDAITIKRNAHAPNGVNCVAWLDDNTCVTGATDGLVNIWEAK